MIKPIIRDVMFLQKKAVATTKSDLYLAKDLEDTLQANKEHCVGLAANMIGEAKAAIIINMGITNLVMFNPKIIDQSGPYQTEEGCLSLLGVRPTQRFENVTVEFFDKNWNKQSLNLTGFSAQICQHECDHLNGIII